MKDQPLKSRAERNRIRAAEATLAEEGLKKNSLALMEDLAEKNADGFAVWKRIPGNPVIFFLRWNRRMEEITGYTLEEINRLGWCRTVCPDPVDEQRMAERLERVMAGEDLRAEEWVVTTKWGEKRTCSISTSAANEETDGAHVFTVIRDITDHQKALTDLAGAKGDWERTFDAVSDLIMILDDRQRIILLNKAAAETFGLSAETSKGTFCFQSVHGTDVCPPRCPFQKLSKDLEEHSEEVFDERLGKTFHVKVSPVVDSNGRLSGCVHISRDIDDYRKTKEALRAHEELLRRSQEIAHVGSWDIDLETNRLVWSEEVYRIVGVAPHEFPATYEGFLDRVHPDDRAAVDTAYSGSVRAGNNSYEIDHRVVKKDSGEIRHVHEKCEHVRDSSGRIVRSVGIVQDITERKRAEELLRESEEKFRQLAENTDDVFWMTEVGNPRKIAYVSPAFQSIRGSGHEDLSMGSGIFDRLIHDHDRDRVHHAYEELLLGNKDYDVEYRIRRPDGSIRWIWDRAFPVRDERGEIRRVAGIAQDVTLRKDQELQQASLLEEIKRFAYIVSHDLRAPLANVRGFADELEASLDTVTKEVLAVNDCVSPEARARLKFIIDTDIPESIGFIKSSISRMDHLIAEIMKLSRMGRRELALERINMNELVDAVLKSLAHQVATRGLRVSVGRLPEIVADRTAMEQVMGNLADNSIKYLDRSRPGELEIAGWIEDDRTIFRVRDNGVGIETADLQRIFQPFQRGRRREEPGEGMGLAYVLTLVRRHGGTVWCESEPGVGSAFIFTISNRLAEEGGGTA